MRIRGIFWFGLFCSAAILGCGKKQEEPQPAETAPVPQPQAVQPAAAPASGATGLIEGRILYTGAAPAPQPLGLDADPACTALRNGQPLFTEDLIVGAGQGLKNALVYVKSGLEGRNFQAPSTAAQLDQRGCQYQPHVLALQMNQPLEIINSDATLHNVHGMPQLQKDFNLGMPVQNMKLTRQFAQPEVMVKFKCDVHPWMGAYVGVLPHPFFAVTGPDGFFRIPEVPEGSYTLEIWHEKLGTQTKEVQVSQGSPASVEAVFS